MEEFSAAIVPEPIRRIADSTDRKLAWQFFVFFSRFEYALKRSKYLMPGTGDAQAHWDLFASDHNAKFAAIEDPALASAVAYFKNAPPKKQTRDNGKLGWAEPRSYDKREPLLVWLLLAIRTVRNNLFHGGKFPQFPVTDPSRDRELIESAITILGYALTLNQDVRHRFGEGIEL